MTPAARNDTAMGMKITTLKAAEKRMRSVRTAKTSPTAVTTVGATTTQMTLFLMAVRVEEFVNICRYLSTPTKRAPDASKKLRHTVYTAGYTIHPTSRINAGSRKNEPNTSSRRESRRPDDARRRPAPALAELTDATSRLAP